MEALAQDNVLHKEDTQSPSWLIPQARTYPLEQVIFQTLVMDTPNGINASNTKPLEKAAYIFDTTELLADTISFDKVTTGFKLVFSQEWYMQGVALGQLLHSVTLAPGESVRLAMTDWSRRVSAQHTEDLRESEVLNNQTMHKRSISEVTDAVMYEAQQGFSNFGSSSQSVSSGSNSSGGFLGFFGGADSRSNSSNNTNSWGFTNSTGSRNFAASMQQNIMDSTQQHASTARNRRATVVEEITERKKKNATTRVITNYNHMHALTMQYYEVMQIYRAVLRFVAIDSCLFIPFRKIDFVKEPKFILMFRYEFAQYALDQNIAKKILVADEERLKDEKLLDHFKENNAYYNHVIFYQLDSSRLTRLLSRYHYLNQPLIDLVDSTPITVIDNLLVFRMGSLRAHQAVETAEEKRIQQWMTQHGFSFEEDEKEERTIALPSGGVHSEGVLSQSNCAEEIDLTRFWNWQESPILFQPTEIDPVDISQTSHPARSVNPGHFGNSPLSIQAPAVLPNPGGTEAALSGLVQGANAFRNQSGAENAAVLGKTTLQQAAASDQHAGEQAGQVLDTAMQTQVGVVKAVAPLIAGSVMPGGEAGMSGSTMEGGMLNLGRSIDNGRGGQQLERTFTQGLMGTRAALVQPLIENSAIFTNPSRRQSEVRTVDEADLTPNQFVI